MKHGASLWVYRRLLLVLPGEFRAEAGEEMEQVFGDQLGAAAGFRARARLWAATLVDVLYCAAAERTRLRGRRRRTWTAGVEGREMANWRATVANDVRQGVRHIMRRPRRGVVAAGTLGVGLAASLVMVVLVRDILQRPLPYAEPDRLVRLYEVTEAGRRFWPSWPNTRDWREHARALSGVVAASAAEDRPVLLDGRGLRVPVAAYSRGFLEILGVRPVRGRTFLEAENAPGGAPVAVVSWRFWRDELQGGSLEATTLMIGTEPHRIVGVLPSDFRFLGRGGAWGEPAVWTPLERSSDLGPRASHGYHVVGRLAGDVTLDDARAELDLLAARLKADHREFTHADRVAAHPLTDEVVGGVRRSLWLLLAGGIGVLVVASLNLAATLISHGIARTRELTIRLAVGAGRLALVRQLVTEALVLAVPGLLVGVGLAAAGLQLVRSFGAVSLPRLDGVALDGGDVALAAALAVLVAVAAALVPALAAGRRADSELRGRGRGEGGPERQRLWSSFVMGQAAATVVLLIGGALLLRSFLSATGVNLGYEPAGVVAVDITLPESRYGDSDARVAYYETVLERIRGLPGVAAAGLTNVLPYETSWPTGPVQREGVEDRSVWAATRLVDRGFFEVLRLPRLRGGRLPGPDPDAPGVLIDRRIAETLWIQEDPIGARLSWGNPVAGVVGSVREWDQDVPTGAYYLDYRSAPERILTMHLLVRSAVDPSSHVPTITAALRELDPLVPVRARPLVDDLRAALAERRLVFMLAGAFALVTLLLACVGVYSVVSFAVGRRRREAAVRLAIGARPEQVRMRLAWHGAAPALAGVGLGAMLAVPGAAALRSQLFRVGILDPVAFTGGTAVLVVAVLVAAYLPARRSGRVEPAMVLREE